MGIPTIVAEDKVGNILKWVLLAVAIVTFAMLGWTTVETYRAAPPQPDSFVTNTGKVLMTQNDIYNGKAGFQRAGLMDYGSIYGMGSYFGEDYTADILVKLATATEDNIAHAEYGKPLIALNGEHQMGIRAAMQAQLQGIDLTKKISPVPDALAAAITAQQDQITSQLLHHDFVKGYTKAYSLTPGEARATSSFLIYSSLTTVARRPGGQASWTQNWPYEPLVGNTPTTSTFIWTWVSFCFTFFMFGAIIFIYQRWLAEHEPGEHDAVLASFAPLTLSQRKAGKYFLVVAAVFLLQILVGSLMAHYYTERTAFYGLPIDTYLPFNFLRSVHIQAPIIWIGVAWIGGALFLAPAIAGREAKWQGLLVDVLFYVTLAVVAGALLGNYFGLMGTIKENWFWFGNQGLSYIEIGRFWQIGFFAGLMIWSILVFRALWPTRETLIAATGQFWTGRIRLEHLIWASTSNIAILYAFGMIPLTGIEKSFTITDFWRWWVVHLWVEQSFEFFAAAISAYLLMAVGLVSRRLAERAVYLELILIFLGGVLGTGHHFYWAGAPGMWVPLGTMFSFIEVLPLVLLIMEAIQQHALIKAHKGFKYELAYLYIIGAAFWNFVGAGVFGGGTLNAPLVNYYEHGTFLTLNHAHTALFGAFGLLGLGLVYFCLRYIAGDKVPFKEGPGRWAFWLYNLGLVMWVLLNFFPIGWAQLADVYEHGLAHARSMAFYNTMGFWQWMRLPGDVVFAAGAVIMAWDFLLKLLPMVQRKV